jgi:hypothetical protein
MGITVGLYDEKELANVDETERKLLKEQAIQFLSSDEVRKIISEKPDLLPEFLAKHYEIRQILRDRTKGLLDQFKKP